MKNIPLLSRTAKRAASDAPKDNLIGIPPLKPKVHAPEIKTATAFGRSY